MTLGILEETCRRLSGLRENSGKEAGLWGFAREVQATHSSEAENIAVSWDPALRAFWDHQPASPKALR